MEITKMYEQALLSESSYADFSNLTNEQSFIDALTTSGLSQTQAEEFVTQWRVVDHQPNTVNGLSATLFERIDISGQGTGEFTLAVRGTEFSLLDPRDLVIDAGLAVGLVPQKDALNAYYDRLVAEGKLTSTQQLSVAGHSLGGFLAQLFAIDHTGVVDHAYTYNAPGIGGVVAEVLDIFGMAAAQLNSSRIDNIYAAPGSEATAGLGTLLGTPIPVFIEESGNPFNNHRIGLLTDAMAVHDLLSTLDPSLAMEAINGILQAASATDNSSLETTIAAVGTLFGEQFQSTETSREELYQNIQQLTDNNVLFGQHAGLLTIESLTDQNASDLISLASSGIAYRYALVNGNTFAITGDDSLYAQYNGAGELELYDSQSGLGSLTSDYLDDRATFLATKIQFNTTDSSVKGPETIEYHDLASDTLVMVTATTASASRRIVFGSDGNDSLTQGGDKEDHLYGGAGDDLLEGRGGADYLEGGKGHDTYRAGDGDTLFDLDGNGRVLLEGKPLNGGIRQEDGSYRSADGIFTYQLADGTLTVTGFNKTLTINDFTSGDLGISLDDAAPEPGDTTLTVLGDRLRKDFDKLRQAA